MNRKDRRSAHKQGKGGQPFAPVGAPSPAALGGNLFAAAVGHFRAGALDAAERACRDVLTLDPNHAGGLHLLGMIAFAAGRPEAALELIGKAIAQKPRSADCHLNLGQVLRALGRLDEAAQHLTQACALKRDLAPAHLNLGDLLVQQGKPGDARACYERALAIDPRLVPAQHGLACLSMQQGRLDDAVAQFRRVLALQPDYAEAASNLGVALAAQGKRDEAEAQYRRALALKPELVDVYRNLGRLVLARGDVAEALGLARRGLVVKETEEGRAFFVQCVKNLQLMLDNGDIGADVRDDLRGLVARALAEGWSRPGELSALAATLFKMQHPAKACIERAASASPARLAAHDLWGPQGLAALAGDRLLRALLESAPVHDVAVERFLTAARAALMDVAARTSAASTIAQDVLGFYCALARQCFINEYVFAHTEDELRAALQLRDALGAALASGTAVCALWPVAVAAYFPLHALPYAEQLLARHWPEAIAALLDQQVREPRAERHIRPTIPILTAIEDNISLAVQRQYEDMPYPRWIKAAPVGKPMTLDWYVRNQFPLASIRNLGTNAPLDILIAGCGTGQHAIETAQRFAPARVLAIDLSRASLSYARRKTDELGLRQIDYAQADILKLGGLDQTFDLIEAVGVLHHLGDPAAGWRVLLALLRPGGFMHVGLYSALARTAVTAARAFIAERGYASTADDIRACRQALFGCADGTPLHTVTKFSDFYTISECRDLLFHVQEHQFTIPEIKAFLAANDLAFLGFGGPAAAEYRRYHPDDKAMTDLDRWHAFETQSPMNFVNMYQFWVQKRAGGG
jgi:Tfp pilus assembly protein PilF/SAM-dependent methyltransferase